MKRSRFSVRLVLAVAFVLGLAAIASAQAHSLPGGLNESSSLEQVFKWLDENSFRQVRIGLEMNSTGRAQRLDERRRTDVRL